MAYNIITVPSGFTPLTSATYTKFGGTLWDSPNSKVTISGWQNYSTSNSAAAADVDKLYDNILSYVGTRDGVIVQGHSRGGQVQYKLFRERYQDLLDNVDPARILFISSGNPERRYNGACVVNTAGDPPTYPGVSGGGYGYGYGLPPWGTGPFKMLDIARQYDRWADYPNSIGNTAALDKIFGGAEHGSVLSDNGVHGDYTTGVPSLGGDGLPVNPDEWARTVEGNVTYLTAPAVTTTTAAAETFFARLHGGAFTSNRIADIPWRDLLARSSIEAAYARPALTLPRYLG